MKFPKDKLKRKELKGSLLAYWNKIDKSSLIKEGSEDLENIMGFKPLTLVFPGKPGIDNENSSTQIKFKVNSEKISDLLRIDVEVGKHNVKETFEIEMTRGLKIKICKSLS